jgi:predicted nucleic acid-binding protein
VDRRWVVNASPLILLAKVGHVALLHELTTELVIPRGVVEEVEEGSIDDPARLWLAENGTDDVRDIERSEAVIEAWDLGKGESDVLTWAYQNAGWEAIVDDRAARNCATALRIPVRGTLGVILLAKQKGKIEKASIVFEQLQDAGLRIDASLLAKALQLAGE